MSMSEAEAAALIRFANQHDDGSPQPRAVYDEARGAVIVTSTELTVATGESRLVTDAVRSMRELRVILGY